MAFTGTVIYDDTNFITTILFDEGAQRDAFFLAYLVAGYCRFINPQLNVFLYFHYDTEAHYLSDKATIAAILAGL